MTKSEQIVIKLLDKRQMKSYHPITCINPTEWFTPTEVKIEDDRVIWIRNDDTCWFRLDACEIREVQ